MGLLCSLSWPQTVTQAGLELMLILLLLSAGSTGRSHHALLFVFVIVTWRDKLFLGSLFLYRVSPQIQPIPPFLPLSHTLSWDPHVLRNSEKLSHSSLRVGLWAGTACWHVTVTQKPDRCGAHNAIGSFLTCHRFMKERDLESQVQD